jgi:hypothetical protein
MLPFMKRQRKTGQQKMRDYRDRLRNAGLRPIQVWVPDIRSPGFAATLRMQVRAVDAGNEAAMTDFIQQEIDQKT